jgi:hypothetical protein
MQRSQCRAPIMRLMIPKSRIRPDIFESDRVFTRSLHDGDHRHDDDIYKYGLQVILRPQSQRPPRTVARPTWTFGAIASARESAAHRQSQADRRTIHPLLLDATSRISRPAYQPLAMRPLSYHLPRAPRRSKQPTTIPTDRRCQRQHLRCRLDLRPSERDHHDLRQRHC